MPVAKLKSFINVQHRLHPVIARRYIVQILSRIAKSRNVNHGRGAWRERVQQGSDDLPGPVPVFEEVQYPHEDERGRLRVGERVGILAENRLEVLTTYLGAMRMGAIAVPVNFKLAAPTIAHIFRDSGIRLAFVDEARAAQVPAGGRTDR